MSSIGPQLPPHLSKRKRTPEDDSSDPPPSPPAKNQRTLGPSLLPTNNDEIDLDDEDDENEDYGPRAPAPALGPTLPPGNAINKSGNKDEIDLANESDSDDMGPAPPPSTSTSAAAGPARPPSATTSSSAPGRRASVASSSSSDDDFGPSLPSATAGRPTIGPAMPPPPPAKDDQAPKRDAWMLAPPTSSGYSERDPTRIRTRKFASKSSASSAKHPSDPSIPSIWTETPEQKLERLQNAVLGRTSSSSAADQGTPDKTKRELEEEERNRRISAKIEASRGKSLYEEHSGRRRDGGRRPGEEEEDDPSQRGFDREKDMAIGGKIGTAQRRELVTKAANFGGRFQKGSFL